MTPTHLLAFETRWPHNTPTKTETIRRELGITEIRYTVLLHRAAHTLEGIRAYPVTARRVREHAAHQAARRHARTAA